ncbi:MAG: hypothetical protein FWG87_09085 [Defluviitaleaceae bacterium]|nr:hypothetical protein [Defluviitaleaceae bacterium]
MVTYTLHSKLPTAKAAEFYSFMTNPPAEVYKNWLPEEHYEFHIVKRGEQSPIGDMVYFDQNIGNKYRMKFYAAIKAASKPDCIVFQMRKYGINLPAYLDLHFSDTPEGLMLTETLRIGLNGLGRICDPFIRLVYGKDFYREFKEHHRREWQRLAEIL